MPEPVPNPLLVIACGALAREINALKRANSWGHLHMQCIDAQLHNRPALIPQRLRQKILQNLGKYDRIFVAYADCGTGGDIDRLLDEFGIERLPGAHCYQFLAGFDRFNTLSRAEPGTFYLTDFLARHFERLVVKPLKLIEHPELRDAYFGNYRRLVFLSQVHDDEVLQMSRNAAAFLTLEFEHVHCGYGELESGLNIQIRNWANGQKNSHILA